MSQAFPAAVAVFRTFLLRAEAVVASLFLTAMVVAILLQVVARFFSTALTWTDEVAAFSFVWASLLGAAIAVETGSLHVVDALVRMMPLPLRRLVSLCVYAFVLGTLGVLMVSGLEIVEVVSRQRSSVLGLPMSYVYAAMPVSALLMTLSLLLDWRLYLVPGAREGRAHG